MDLILVITLLYISLLELTHQNQALLLVVFVEQRQVITQKLWKQLSVQVEARMETEFL